MSKKDAFLQFLKAARSLQDRGLNKEAILQFAKNEFGELSELFKKQIDSLFKPKKGIENIKLKDEVFDDTVIKLPIDDTGVPFNPNDPLKQYGKPKKTDDFNLSEDDPMGDLEKIVKGEGDTGLPKKTKNTETSANKRMLTEDEIAELDMDIGGLEYTNDFDGTVGSANKLRKERAEYIADMELEYKKGNLDPEPGSYTPQRKKFLEQKYEEMQASGDNRLMTRDEVEELASFDLQIDMDKAVEKFKKKDAKEKKIIKDFDPGDRDPSATGGRAGYADGTPDKKGILDMIDVQASGSKSGKNRITGAPDGITIDSESINAIIKADIPISQKIDLIAEYKYGKNRDRVDYKDQEIKMDEGGYKDQDIGFGYNQGGEGISGSLIRDLRTGDDDFKIRFSKKFAEGGRIGLKAGMTKRAFLKLMGGVGATIGAAKSGLLGLGGKQATKEVAKEIITTPAAAGKPAWFDALVTRVIREGDDVTKTMATKDREIVYRKKIDDETEVLVTQDLDEGVTRIDIDDSTRNVTGFDDPPTVSLQVTDEIVEEGGARIKPEFKATENDYRNYATDPDGGYETEFVENTVENTKDLTSDLTKVKSYATNKKETMKEFVESKKRKDNVKYANENPSSYAADRGPDYDPSDYIDDMADDFASGGIARMLGE